MNSLFGVKLTKVEFPDGLSFVAVQESGPTLYIAIFIVFLGIAAACWIGGHQIFAVWIVIAGGFGLVKNIAVGPETSLTVNQREVHASGNLPKLLSDSVRVPVSEIKRIGWFNGGENQPSGLYVRHGLLSNTCVLPGISKQQAVEIRDAIAGKFPDFPLGDVSSGFSLDFDVSAG
ncbi:MAG TPA: hypothetical protein VKB38_11955 [Terracidiphilus sp.]|nr:hypothetical protein [Terracidiphilus sp.]